MGNGYDLQKGQAFLLTDVYYRRYFSGVDLAEGMLLLSKDPVYFTDSRYILALKEKLANSNIKVALYKSLQDVKAEIINQKITTLFLDYSHTTMREYQSYKIFDTEFCDGEDKLKVIRSVKTEEELKNIKKACEITEQAFYESIKSLKVGITEKEFKEILVNRYIELGATKESFDTIIAFGKGSAVPHHETGDTKLEKDTVVLVDTGCVYNGYCSDYTRTLFFGNPSEKFISAYNAVKDANEKAEKEIVVGTDSVKADEIARNVLTERNMGEYFTHSLGHGIGLEIHEFPNLSPKSSSKLKENQVFSIEPGVYFDNEFGIRIEDTVVLTKDGIKRLFTDSKELLIIK